MILSVSKLWGQRGCLLWSQDPAEGREELSALFLLGLNFLQKKTCDLTHFRRTWDDMEGKGEGGICCHWVLDCGAGLWWFSSHSPESLLLPGRGSARHSLRMVAHLRSTTAPRMKCGRWASEFSYFFAHLQNTRQWLHVHGRIDLALTFLFPTLFDQNRIGLMFLSLVMIFSAKSNMWSDRF